MASPLTRHLIHKAIGQSGAFFTSPTRGMAEKTVPEKEQDGVKFAASVGAASLAELRAKPADELLAAVMKTGGWGYSPGVDNYFMPEKVAAIYAAGQQSKIPLLAGWTSSELGMSVAMNPKKPTAATFPDKLREQFKDQADAAGPVYPTLHRRTSAAVGRRPRQRPLHLLLDVEVDRGAREVRTRLPLPLRSRAAGGEPVEPLRRCPRFGHRVLLPHARLEEGDWKPEDRETARMMAGSFANFVKTGNPNGPGLPPWPEFGKTRQVMVLDGAQQGGPRAGPGALRIHRRLRGEVAA